MAKEIKATQPAATGAGEVKNFVRDWTRVIKTMGKPTEETNTAATGMGEGRARFEAWAKRRHGLSTETWDDSGNYKYHDTRNWWECWQAALSAAPVAAGGLGDDHVRRLETLGDSLPKSAQWDDYRLALIAAIKALSAQAMPVVGLDLIKRARSEYRDSDAAGDVLDWMEEQLETDLAAQPAPVVGGDAIAKAQAWIQDFKFNATEDEWEICTTILELLAARPVESVAGRDSDAVIRKLRCLGPLLQQLNAQEAAKTVADAIALLAARPGGDAVVACRECGSSVLNWDVVYRNSSEVVEGRLRTSDVKCFFVLGCNECSETLQVVPAERVCATHLLPAHPAQAGGESNDGH